MTRRDDADLAASVAFYKALGFEQNPQFSDDASACMVWSEAIYAMLLTHAKWRTFTQRPFPAPGTAGTAGSMVSLSMDSRGAVDTIQAAAATLRGHLDVAHYGAEWFRQGEVPSGVLSTDQHLTATQAAEWKAQWKAQRAQHDTAVLGSGLAYTHLSLKPAEVQWLESQRFNTTAVARLFGIPCSPRERG